MRMIYDGERLTVSIRPTGRNGMNHLVIEAGDDPDVYDASADGVNKALTDLTAFMVEAQAAVDELIAVRAEIEAHRRDGG